MEGVNNVNHGDRLNDFEFETAFLKGDDRINTQQSRRNRRIEIFCHVDLLLNFTHQRELSDFLDHSII